MNFQCVTGVLCSHETPVLLDGSFFLARSELNAERSGCPSTERSGGAGARGAGAGKRASERAECECRMALRRTFSMGGGVGRVEGRAHGRTLKTIVARSGRRAWIAGGWGGHTEPKQLRECSETSSGTQRPNDTHESLNLTQ